LLNALGIVANKARQTPHDTLLASILLKTIAISNNKIQAKVEQLQSAFLQEEDSSKQADL
jgi:hypothetical protein